MQGTARKSTDGAVSAEDFLSQSLKLRGITLASDHRILEMLRSISGERMVRNKEIKEKSELFVYSLEDLLRK